MRDVDDAWREAWRWLGRQRKHPPHHADVWDLRWRIATGKQTLPDLYDSVRGGEYVLKPLQLVVRRDGTRVPVRAADALVLKWVALRLQTELPLHPACTHTRGYGGCAGARKRAEAALEHGAYRFLYRTDIRGYYRHIRKDDIGALLDRHVGDPVLRDLAWQAVSGDIEDGGTFFTPQGLARGNSLSPLLGSALLYDMDFGLAALSGNGVFCVRYMDDLLLMAHTRWGLRRARRLMMDNLTQKGFTIARDKTQVGSLPGVSFTWLGYRYDTGPQPGEYTKTKLPVRGRVP